VVGEAGDKETALRLWRSLAPDVVLAGSRSAQLELAPALASEAENRPDRPLRIITLIDGSQDLPPTGSATATGGFLLQRASAEELAYGIRMVSAGYHLIPPGQALVNPGPGEGRNEVMRRARERWLERVSAAGLTHREIDVFDLLTMGMSNAEISAELTIGQSTVKSHVRGLLAKLGLRNRTEVVIFLYENAYGPAPAAGAGTRRLDSGARKPAQHRGITGVDRT
jgi:DNA-binding NarL/FixJ family response regulator